MSPLLPNTTYWSICVGVMLSCFSAVVREIHILIHRRFVCLYYFMAGNFIYLQDLMEKNNAPVTSWSVPRYFLVNLFLSACLSTQHVIFFLFPS